MMGVLQRAFLPLARPYCGRAVSARATYRLFSTETPKSSCGTKEPEPPTIKLPSLIRSLMEMRTSGTFSTIVIHSEKVSGPQVYGTPFMPYVLIGKGTPVFALKPYSEHVSHLEGYPDASLVVHPLTPQKIAPSQVGLFRVNITGEMNQVPESLHDEIHEKFCEVHPAAKAHAPYNFYTLNIKNVYYHARQITDMISVQEYEEAELDPVVVGSKQIIAKLNNINSQYALILMCKDYGNFTATEVVAYWVDKFGFNVVAKNEEGKWTDVRFPFPYEMTSPSDCMDNLQSSIDHIITKYTNKTKN